VTEPRATRLTYVGPSKPVVEKCQITDLKEKNVLVKTLFSGISRGTESLVFHGKVPLSEAKRMRCPHQTGDFGFPVSYGYAAVGKVIETKSDDLAVKGGDTVFVLHPHQDYFVVDDTACNPVPANLPPARAVLSANMETALNAVWDAQIEGTKRHAIIGAGVVGLLTAFCIRTLTGITPAIIDTNIQKRKVAKALGLDFYTPGELQRSDPPEMERIFNTSASGQGLQMAIDLAGFEARIIEMSWYGEREVTLKLGGGFHSRRLQLVSSQVGHVAPTKRTTHTYGDRMQEAMNLLTDPALDVLLEPAIMFEALPDHLGDIFSNKSSVLCQLVEYNNP